MATPPRARCAGGGRGVAYAIVRAKRRWPQKPTGERGFHWAPLTKREAAEAFPDAPTARCATTARMVGRLERFGVMPDGRGVRGEAVGR